MSKKKQRIKDIIEYKEKLESVKNGNGGEGGVKSLQEYHSLIK